MRYVSLLLVAIGALMFPFAAKRLTIGLSADSGHDVRTAVIEIVIGVIFVAAGQVVMMRDETTSKWRDRRRGSRRIKL